MKTPLSSAYLRFLHIANALSREAAVGLKPQHLALLESIATAWFIDEPMSVRAAIAQGNLGSPATLHKRLMLLRKDGYVSEMAVNGDRRTKLLAPTPKAIDYFDKLGGAMTSQKPDAHCLLS